MLVGREDRKFSARVVQRVDDRQQIHRHVDRTGDSRHLGRRQLAAGVDAVRNHQHCAMPVVALGNCTGRLGYGIEERRIPHGVPFETDRRTRARSLVNSTTSLKARVEREERRFVARVLRFMVATPTA